MLLRAIVLLPVTAVGLRVVGFRRWKTVLEWFSGDAGNVRVSKTHQPLELAQEIARLVRSAELHSLGQRGCVERSLVLSWLLRRHGLPAQLHIAARKNQGREEARTWVELRGRALKTDDVHEQYRHFDGRIAPEVEPQ